MQIAFSRWHRANGMQLLQGFFAALPTLAASGMAIGHILSRTRLAVACPHRSPTEVLSARQPKLRLHANRGGGALHGGTRGCPLRRCLCLAVRSCTAATLLRPHSPSSPFQIIISRPGVGLGQGIATATDCHRRRPRRHSPASPPSASCLPFFPYSPRVPQPAALVGLACLGQCV